MKKSVLDDDFTRVVIFLTLGAVYFIACMRLPPFRQSAFLISLLISLVGGFFSRERSQALSTAAMFAVGMLIGLFVITLLKFAMGNGSSERAVDIFRVMLKAALLIDLLSMLPWIAGIPIGRWARRKLD